MRLAYVSTTSQLLHILLLSREHFHLSYNRVLVMCFTFSISLWFFSQPTTKLALDIEIAKRNKLSLNLNAVKHIPVEN